MDTKVKAMAHRGERRYETFSVSLFAQEIAVLDRVGAIFGMGRSQTLRFVINDWERMKQEQESN